MIDFRCFATILLANKNGGKTNVINRRKWEEGERGRQRKLIYWGQLHRDQEPCISYGTTRYQAHLAYVPPGWDTYAVCKETPIHDKDIVPTECHFDVGIFSFFIQDINIYTR